MPTMRSSCVICSSRLSKGIGVEGTRAPLHGPARTNSSSVWRSNLERSSGFHRVTDPVVAQELDDAVVGGPAAGLDVEDAHVARTHGIRAPMPRAAVQVHARVL